MVSSFPLFTRLHGKIAVVVVIISLMPIIQTNIDLN